MTRACAPLLLLATTGCALLIPQPALPDRPAAEVRASRLFAGAARVALTPVPRPVPLAGFGPNPPDATTTYVDPATGLPEHLHVRALSLRGDRELAPGIDRLVLVSLDSLIVNETLRRGIVAEVADVASRAEVVVCATHTHFGIGGFWKGDFPEWASVGRWDAAMTARTIRLAAAAVRSAVACERPATWRRGRASAPDLVASRALESDIVDAGLLALALDGTDGRPIARIVAFGSHPTELFGTGKLSPSWPGATSRRFERDEPGAITLVLQGGVGNQKPRFPPRIWENGAEVPELPRLGRSRAYGATVALVASEALARAPTRDTAVLRVVRARLALPFPTLGACPFPVLDRIGAIAVALPYWPEHTWLTVVRLGDVALAFAPFELCADTTLLVKERLEAAGYADVAVVSHANGWLGYAPHVVPWPWNTSGSASFGGVGMGQAVGRRLTELGRLVGPEGDR